MEMVINSVFNLFIFKLKSDRFGMEIGKACAAIMLPIMLKSDRFGMEIYAKVV